jgi:hypothetical protein
MSDASRRPTMRGATLVPRPAHVGLRLRADRAEAMG